MASEHSAAYQVVYIPAKKWIYYVLSLYSTYGLSWRRRERERKRSVKKKMENLPKGN